MKYRYYVGDAVRLKISCLGNPMGTPGFVFNTYNLVGEDGAQVIFPNGEYDGFSPDEQDSFLEHLGTTNAPYTFTNVMKLSEEFRRGEFTEVFNKARLLSEQKDSLL